MKRTKRNSTKYPGLTKQTTLKIREELVDQDYINKLSESEKKWLSDFNEEWINAKLDHPGKKFHNTKKEKKLINDMNNSRNRDIQSRAKVQGKLEEYKPDKKVSYSVEDNLIEKIDAGIKLNKLFKRVSTKS